MPDLLIVKTRYKHKMSIDKYFANSCFTVALFQLYIFFDVALISGCKERCCPGNTESHWDGK